MRSEGKKRTLELSLIQGFSKIEKLFGGAFRTTLAAIVLIFNGVEYDNDKKKFPFKAVKTNFKWKFSTSFLPKSLLCTKK